MKKSQYSLIIFNSETQYNKSLIISKIQIYLFCITLIALIGYGIFATYSLYLKPQTANQDTLVTMESLDKIMFSPPISGTVFITSEKTTTHKGIDIACEHNTNVQSISKGVVIFSNFLEDYGNTIIILHDKNIISKYSHLQKSNIQENDFVDAGQVIAKAGKTGNLAKGVHLHFEIWQNNRIIDPLQIIKEYEEINVSIKK